MSTLHDTLSKFTNLYDEEEPGDSPKKKNEDSDIFSSPFSSEDGAFYSTISSSADVMAKASRMKEEKKNRKKSSDEYDINSFSRDFEAQLGEFAPFDDVVDRLFELDEDDELRISLIAQGRKYNQSHSQSGEASEFEKAFTKQETALNQLITDLEKDIGATEKDINNMRLSRVRSPKALSDLISVKGSLYSTKLAAIKEINSIKKNILDLNMKSKKNNEDDSQASMAASLALQQMIEGDARDSLSDSDYRAMARGSMSRGVDGDVRNEIPVYERNAQDDLDEMEAEREYEASQQSEGDLYIQYENMNVQTYAEVDDEDRVVRLVAKDRDGNEVPDYPLPGLDEGTFTIHEDLGTVTDSFHRNYILEKV